MQTILYNENGVKVTVQKYPDERGIEYQITYDNGEGFFTQSTQPKLDDLSLKELIRGYKITKCESEDDVDNNN